MHQQSKHSFKKSIVSVIYKTLLIAYLLFCIAYQLNGQTTAYFLDANTYYGKLAAADVFQEDMESDQEEQPPGQAEKEPKPSEAIDETDVENEGEVPSDKKADEQAPPTESEHEHEPEQPEEKHDESEHHSETEQQNDESEKRTQADETENNE